MVKKVIFSILSFGFFFLGLLTLQAQQKYTTHAVEKGETLYSIAKKYKVTPASILKQNPEIKNKEEIKPNTILVISLSGATQVTDSKNLTDNKVEQEVKPIGYTRHKVRKKETLFGITQEYKITEDQLKRYNKRLYAEPLQKGMVLQIPKYAEVVEDEETDIAFLTYTVQPKETRWSIANKYGITIDSLLSLNPELPKNTAYLSVGQTLKLPRPKGDSLKEQQVGLFESYTVPKSIGIFRISQNYGISVDSVITLNPEIKELGGLKEGMVLRLPKKQPTKGVVNTDNYIFYQVKPKQTVFNLTQNLKISRDSLFALNPELENGLKAGMVLKLPRLKENQLQVKNALVIDQINLLDSIKVENKPNLMFLLPFRIDRIDFNNTSQTENQLTKRKDMSIAMGMYTGAMVAIDSMKRRGISVNVKVFDTEMSEEKVRSIMETQSLYGIDAIVGPIAPKLISAVAATASQSNVPVIVPFASDNDLNFNNVFYTVPHDSILRNRILEKVAEMRKDEQIIVIADAKHNTAKEAIIKKFPKARVAKMSKDGSLHLVDFKAMLSKYVPNWVFVETEDDNLAASLVSIINSSNLNDAIGPKIKVKMFTTNYNNAFEGEDISRPHLGNLEFTFSSPYKINGDRTFSRAYEKMYGIEPDRYAVRGYDITMDLLLKLAYKKNLFETAKFIGQTEYSGNKFDYYNKFTAGYFNKATYLLEYNDDLYIKEVK
ncbi:amino acid ABC transporter substrate-binding protein [Croceivirga radicis]|uniref:amino acid ABC transporter substrate-binding protein n=1 Tax=Croceivirga radicis TaxID=1929488 RepID=UPI00031E0C6B|nr:LysM peptidoglycan-binding domain-containing protein [Croceivirga radicis]